KIVRVIAREADGSGIERLRQARSVSYEVSHAQVQQQGRSETLIVVQANRVGRVVGRNDATPDRIIAGVSGVVALLERPVAGDFPGGADGVVDLHGWIRGVLVIDEERHLIIVDQV